MNNRSLVKRAAILAASVIVLFASVSVAQIRQTSLYLDDGFGHFSILSGASGGGAFTFPVGGGTLITAGNSNSITSLGTIASGVWHGTAVSPTYGGTGLLTLTPYALLAGGTTATGNLQQISGLGLSTQVLTSNGPNALPTWQNAATGSGTVTSVAMTVPSFLSVSATPITTSGTFAVTLSGSALPIANGGTGLTSTPTDGQLLVGQTSSDGYVQTSLTAGAGISITPGSGSITIAATGGGGSAFSAITTGTNTTALLIGSGGSLGTTSGGTIAATTATSFSGSLVGDVTGTQGATVVSAVGGSTAANVHSAELAANAATNANTASTIVKRDASGNFTAGTITSTELSLPGNSTGVSTFQAGTQNSTTINYTLPTSQPSTNQVLAATGVSGTGPYAVTMGWASTGAPIFVYKSAFQDYTSTALVADNDLTIPLVTSATYVFDAFLSFTDENGDQTDAKIAFTVPTGSTLKFGWNTTPGNTNITTTVVNTSGTASQELYIANGNSTYETFVHVKGIVFTSTSTGNLLLKCERVGGSKLRLQADSYMTATRVQ